MSGKHRLRDSWIYRKRRYIDRVETDRESESERERYRELERERRRERQRKRKREKRRQKTIESNKGHKVDSYVKEVNMQSKIKKE